MQANQRWLLILTAGAVVSLLALRAPSENPTDVKVVTRSSSASNAVNPRVESTAQLAEIKPRHFREKGQKDLFNSKSWYVPPPPPPPKKVKPTPPPPPPPPSAPPLPYVYMGSYQEPGGKLQIYLNKAGRLITVTQGEILDSIYRVDGENNGYFTMTYIPLNIKQTLRTR